MSRPCSSASRKGPAVSQSAPMGMATRKSMSPKSSASSLRSDGGLSQQRREFLQHLENWALDHDASPHFHGKISLLPRAHPTGGNFELGKSVTCVLTDTSYPDARQNIVIKLFPPSDTKADSDDRRDSMDMCENCLKGTAETDKPLPRWRYHMVVRSGSGWTSSRTFLSKVYFSRLPSPSQSAHTINTFLAARSKSLGLAPSDKDTVTICPLFHYFPQLPAELQDLILTTAAGLSKHYNLCSDDYGTSPLPPRIRAPISLSTLFGISKTINTDLQPYVYHSTTFHFGLTGFTNFLWQSGPSNRSQVRRLSFHFGKLALLHCIRWFACDAVFGLFEPPVATNPRSLQYFWRAQIQDLIKDLFLDELTIDMEKVPKEDLAMVVAILKTAFGKVGKVMFVDGGIRAVRVDDERVTALAGKRTWRDLCLGYFVKYRRYSYYFKLELVESGDEVGLGKDMDQDCEFFGKEFEVLGGTEGFPVEMEKTKPVGCQEDVDMAYQE